MNVLFSEHANEIYKSIIDYNPDAIVTFSIEGYIVGVNQAVTKILGYSMEEMQSLSYRDIFDPRQLDYIDQFI